MQKRSMSNEDLVQVKNPRSNRDVNINPTVGLMLSTKQSEGPDKGIPIVNRFRLPNHTMPAVPSQGA